MTDATVSIATTAVTDDTGTHVAQMEISCSVVSDANPQLAVTVAFRQGGDFMVMTEPVRSQINVNPYTYQPSESTSGTVRIDDYEPQYYTSAVVINNQVELSSLFRSRFPETRLVLSQPLSDADPTFVFDFSDHVPHGAAAGCLEAAAQRAEEAAARERTRAEEQRQRADEVAAQERQVVTSVRDTQGAEEVPADKPN
jgi:hypothetical protein